jgi:ribulose-5-phosphate 4-epimerase/fuculose-1-phosphate aldolase
MTVRDPELHDHFWVNPRAVPFNTIKTSDLVLVNSDGEVVEGTRSAVLPAALVIHTCVHEARPDVIGAIHTHSPYGQVWSTLGRLLDPITQVSCTFYNDHGLLDDYTGVVLDFETGERLTEALGQTKAVILQNHGLLTVGKTIDEAAIWFIRMENYCKMQLMAEAAGTPVIIRSEVAQATHDRTGPYSAWNAYQPLFDKLVAEEPEVLD